MPVDKDKIVAGVTLAARYKGAVVTCKVATNDEGALTYTVNGQTFNSPSKAGSKAAGDTSVNGYRFWSLEAELGEAKAKAEPKPKAEKVAKVAKTKTTTKPEDRAAPNIKKLRKQPADQPEGITRYFCSACMKGFDGPSTSVPKECPEGHARDGDPADDAGQPTKDNDDVIVATEPAAEPVELVI